MRKAQTLIVAVLLLALSAIAAPIKTWQKSKPDFTGLTLELQLSKQSILPGELVNITLVLSNKEKRPVQLPGLVDWGVGTLSLCISYNGGPYKRYRGPGWGTRDAFFTEGQVLKPGQQVISRATVLYNQASSAIENEIDTYYALPVAGACLLKAVFHDFGREKNSVESKAVSVLVKEPEGADAEVWNVLKQNEENAYFIQSQGADTFGPKSSVIAKTFEQLLKKYPGSSYVPYLRAALEGFHRDDAQRIKDRRKNVELTLHAAGLYFQNGKTEHGLGLLKKIDEWAEETRLFPQKLPREAYIGLAYLMVKEYSKARDYLDGIAAGLSPSPDNRVLLEATAYAHLASGNQERAERLIEMTRKEPERSLLLKRFHDCIERGEPFTLELYSD